MTRAIALASLVRRPLTLGVRALVTDAQGQVLLVRHTYLPGWYFPGGGVEPGETVLAALIRETREEAGVEIAAARLFGVYHNRRHSPRDHVLLFRADCWSALPGHTVPNREIAEIGWFSATAPPPEATDATRRRLSEVFGRTLPAAEW